MRSLLSRIFNRIRLMSFFPNVLYHEVSILYREADSLKAMIFVLTKRGHVWRVKKFNSSEDRFTICFTTSTRAQFNDIMNEVQDELEKQLCQRVRVNVIDER